MKMKRFMGTGLIVASFAGFCTSCARNPLYPETGFQTYRIIEPVSKHRDKAQLTELRADAFPPRLRLRVDMLLVSDGEGRHSLTDRADDLQGRPFTDPVSDALGVVPKGTLLRAHRVEVCRTAHFPWAGMSYIIGDGEFRGRVINPVPMAWDRRENGLASAHDPKFLVAVP